jgi:hypothetical protein
MNLIVFGKFSAFKSLWITSEPLSALNSWRNTQPIHYSAYAVFSWIYRNQSSIQYLWIWYVMRTKILIPKRWTQSGQQPQYPPFGLNNDLPSASQDSRLKFTQSTRAHISGKQTIADVMPTNTDENAINSNNFVCILITKSFCSNRITQKDY